MLIVPDVLSAEALAEVRTRLAALELADGRASAGPVSREVKRNLQTRPGDPGALELAAMVREALLASHLFLVHAWPVLWSNMLFSRYGPGDGYGLHVDDAFVGTQEPRMRTDFSFTLFLSEPDAYEGGALTLDDPAGARSVRLPAGSAVVYPTSVVHRVDPVTAGERLAAVGWVQSRVRRADRRDILFDLERLRIGADGDRQLLLQKTIGNLLRMWGE